MHRLAVPPSSAAPPVDGDVYQYVYPGNHVPFQPLSSQPYSAERQRPLHEHQKASQQQVAFSSVVYQAPSLHDVDGASPVRMTLILFFSLALLLIRCKKTLSHRLTELATVYVIRNQSVVFIFMLILPTVPS